MLVWQIVGAVAFSGLVSALLRRVLEQYISAPRIEIKEAEQVVALDGHKPFNFFFMTLLSRPRVDF